MSTEENYLDNLLKSITEPTGEALEDAVAEETASEVLSEEKEIVGEESVMDESREDAVEKMLEPVAEETVTEELIKEEPAELDISDIAEEPAVPEEMDSSDGLDLEEIAPDVEIPELVEVPDEMEIDDIGEEPVIQQEFGILDAVEDLEDDKDMALNHISDDLPGLDISESSDAEKQPVEDFDIAKLTDAKELSVEGLDITELTDAEEPSVEGLDISELSDAEESSVEDFDITELTDAEVPSVEGLDITELSDAEGLSVEEIDASGLSDFDISDVETKVMETAGDMPIEEASDLGTDLDIGEIGGLDLSETPDIELAQDSLDDALDIEDIPNIDGPDEILRSETEPEMPDELNLDELDLDIPDLSSSDMDDELGILDSIDTKSDGTLGVDDGLDDVLSMLDDDADLAEINDILKKSDSNEPIQDEMMDLLNQMADDEAALVNAGVKDIEEDGGVALPNMPIETNDVQEGDEAQKSSKKKKKSDDREKKPGAFGKLFNLLTEELPGPTEADYAAEEEKKAAKKQEALTKKEEEKLAKEEAKQAKAEEKEAAKKAKAEAAAQKKKEKEEAKAKKAAEKLAKQGPVRKAKRIPPKKIAAVAAFGASVFGGVLVMTNVLSNQGYLNVARKAFYDGDYKSVYLATYGMNLKDSDVALIQAKSKVILKMQRWYDAYENNLKLGQEREALDSLIRGIEAYDYLNAEAEACDALSDVEQIKAVILGVLQSEYGLSEEQARDLLHYEDALDYTIALNNVITGN